VIDSGVEAHLPRQTTLPFSSMTQTAIVVNGAPENARSDAQGPRFRATDGVSPGSRVKPSLTSKVNGRFDGSNVRKRALRARKRHPCGAVAMVCRQAKPLTRAMAG
jgi:hypothetical protein